MASFLIKRLLGILCVLAATSVLVFGIIHVLPGNVAYTILGEFATPAAVATLEARLGLNDPLWLQYWHWLSDLLQGDFGQSLAMDRPAAPLIAEALGRSAVLAGLSFSLVVVLGIASGMLTAVRAGQTMDHVLTVLQLVFIAIPEFFWAVLGVLVFSSTLRWLPATGYAPMSDGFVPWVTHLVLPVLLLAMGLIAHVSRLTRAAMLETLRSRYVLMARAKGLRESRVLWRHAAPNAMLPAITILAIDFGLLIGGVVVVETVFAYPGLGRLLVFAIERHDLPLLQAGMRVMAASFAAANLMADMAYALLNPRIRHTVAA